MTAPSPRVGRVMSIGGTQPGAVTTARPPVKTGVPAGGESTATGHTDDVVALTPPPANPAAVLSAAVGTAEDPNTIPWPDAPTNALVEVYVSDDDLNEVLGQSGFNGDEADAYSRVYASINLVHNKDCDFYGMSKDGKEEIIALGIHYYEQAVDPNNNENLRYRDGHTNPMPAYTAGAGADEGAAAGSRRGPPGGGRCNRGARRPAPRAIPVAAGHRKTPAGDQQLRHGADYWDAELARGHGRALRRLPGGRHGRGNPGLARPLRDPRGTGPERQGLPGAVRPLNRAQVREGILLQLCRPGRTQRGMTTKEKPRVLPGVPFGGEFTAHAHKDPSIRLDQLNAAEEVFAFHPGTRVAVGNEFGTISEAGKDKNGNVAVNLDSGGTLHLKASRVVPWEAHLDTVMPTVDYNPDPDPCEIMQPTTDRALRGSLVRMRNALESSTSGTYYTGIAFGEAEVASALLDADADPEMIGNARAELLKLGLPLGADHEELSLEAIRTRTAAPLSSLRARRLAGYFTVRAVEMQERNGAIAQKDWDAAEWTKQGVILAYSRAAIRFAEGLPQSEGSFHEERFTRLLAEGETNTDTIIGETFDRGSW